MSTAADTVDFREKAHAMAVVALEDAFHRAVDPETSLKLKLEFTELCTKLADLHPKQQQQQIGGPGFAINIVLGDQAGKTKADAQFIDVGQGEVIESLPSETPDFLPKTLAATINMDLTEDSFCEA